VHGREEGKVHDSRYAGEAAANVRNLHEQELIPIPSEINFKLFYFIFLFYIAYLNEVVFSSLETPMVRNG
jgi:hypothetical protein